jgi:hypothetical protein
MALGDLPDIQPNRLFASRRELFDAGVHTALQAGNRSFSPAAVLTAKTAETLSFTPEQLRASSRTCFTYGARTMTAVRPCGRSRRTFVDGRIGCLAPVPVIQPPRPLSPKQTLPGSVRTAGVGGFATVRFRARMPGKCSLRDRLLHADFSRITTAMIWRCGSSGYDPKLSARARNAAGS